MMKKLIFGLDIGGTKTAVILATPEGEFLDRVQFATKEAGGPYEVLEKACALMEEMLVARDLTPADIAAAGISCGGPLDDRTGVIMSPPNLPGWDEIPVTDLLTKRFGFPAYLQNDANACAVAEWKYGAGRGTRNMAFLTFGTGLGAGLILDGRLYSGTNGNAGEVGHLRLAPDGPVGFGKAGSFEGFCSGGGIAQLASKILGKEGITAKDAAILAREGDEKAMEVFRVCGKRLGEGLSILIDVLNPECIVIGSIYQRCEDLLRPWAMEVIAREALAQAAGVCRVVPAQLGDQIGDYAAIAIAAAKLDAN